MTERKIRIGLLGYGKVAHVYAQALEGLLNATLVSVCGRNQPRRDEFARTWNIASRSNVSDMAKIDGAELVIVCTPHPQHREGTLEALAAGCHVLVEKPMALRVEQCDEMIEAARKNNRVLSVVSQRRWFPPCVRMKAAIDAGKLGRPILLQMTILGWRDEAYYASDPWRGKWDGEGGGILINQAAHQIDLMNWFMQSTGGIEEIQGYWGNFNHPYIEVEDSAAAVIKFRNGALGSILVSNSQNPGIHAKIHVHGDNGASVGVQTDGGSMFIAGMSSITEAPINDLWTIPGEEDLLKSFQEKDEAHFKELEAHGSATVHFFAQQLKELCRALIEETPPPTTGEEGRETIKFIETMYALGGAPGYYEKNRS